jgi:DNA-binding NarL/FixJ family response regulator
VTFVISSKAVPALERGDAERLLRFVAEAESFGGDHPFEGEFLTQLGRLIRADFIGYIEFPDWARDAEPTVSFARPEDELLFAELEGVVDMGQIHPIQLEEDPLLLHSQEGGFNAVKYSDFYTRRELHRSRLYHLLLKPLGVEDSLVIQLRSPPYSRPKMFSLDRGDSDFSERDRAVLDLLQPHLVQLYRASERRRRLQAALALHESKEAAIVFLEADDGIGFASRAAHELLDHYFGEHAGRLPDGLTLWLRERRKKATAEPLRIEVDDRVLVIELVDEALLLEEQGRVPRLTPRESQILELVAEGRTNGEIAERLWVSPLTVRRHLENVYAKLGVHTRTAAAAFVRERPTERLDGSG